MGKISEKKKFIKGMDVSSLMELESLGAKFQDEDGDQPGEAPQILLAAAAQHHKGLPGLGFLLEEPGLHGGYMFLRGVTEPPHPAGGENIDGALSEAGQLIQLQVVLMGDAVQNALVVQRQAESLG